MAQQLTKYTPLVSEMVYFVLFFWRNCAFFIAHSEKYHRCKQGSNISLEWRHISSKVFTERIKRKRRLTITLNSSNMTLTLSQKNSCKEEPPTSNPLISEALLVLVGGRTHVVWFMKATGGLWYVVWFMLIVRWRQLWDRSHFASTCSQTQGIAATSNVSFPYEVNTYQSSVISLSGAQRTECVSVCMYVCELCITNGPNYRKRGKPLTRQRPQWSGLDRGKSSGFQREEKLVFGFLQKQFCGVLEYKAGVFLLILLRNSKNPPLFLLAKVITGAEWRVFFFLFFSILFYFSINSIKSCGCL